MAIQPGPRKNMIEWYEERIAEWGAQSAAIGLSNDQVSSVAVLIANARLELDEFEQRYALARAQTPAYYSAADELRKEGGQLIKIVSAYAQTQNNPGNIYRLAMIPAPATPEEQGAPPVADIVTATLTNQGKVELNWKAPSGGFGSGAYFIVERKWKSNTGEETLWIRIGTTAKREFLDGDVPTGFQLIEYRVISGRSDEVSDASPTAKVVAGNTGLNATGGPTATATSTDESEGQSPMAEAA